MPVRKTVFWLFLSFLCSTAHSYALDCSAQQNSESWIICSNFYDLEDKKTVVAKVENIQHDHSMGANATKTGGLIFFGSENNIFQGTIKLTVDNEKPIAFDYHSAMADVGNGIYDDYFTNSKRSMAFIVYDFNNESNGLKLYNQIIKGEQIKLEYKPFFKDALVVLFTLEGSGDAIETLRHNLD
jgi:hypothetical protein